MDSLQLWRRRYQNPFSQNTRRFKVRRSPNFRASDVAQLSQKTIKMLYRQLQKDKNSAEPV